MHQTRVFWVHIWKNRRNKSVHWTPRSCQICKWVTACTREDPHNQVETPTADCELMFGEETARPFHNSHFSTSFFICIQHTPYTLFYVVTNIKMRIEKTLCWINYCLVLLLRMNFLSLWSCGFDNFAHFCPYNYSERTASSKYVLIRVMNVFLYVAINHYYTSEWNRNFILSSASAWSGFALFCYVAYHQFASCHIENQLSPRWQHNLNALCKLAQSLNAELECCSTTLRVHTILILEYCAPANPKCTPSGWKFLTLGQGN
jgi:hypothetical protein